MLRQWESKYLKIGEKTKLQAQSLEEKNRENDLIRRITEIAHALERSNKNYETGDPKKTRREYFTIFLVSLTALFTAMTFYVLYEQLIVAREAADDAHIAYTAVQRPFIISKNPTIRPRFDENNKLIGWNFSSNWENSGNTPTKNLEISECVYLKNNAQSPSSPHFHHLAGYYQKILIGPKEISSSMPATTITDEDISGIISNRFRFIFMGSAKYGDILGSKEDHITRSCFSVVFTKAPTIEDASHDFSVAPCEGNCADNECKEQREPSTQEWQECKSNGINLR